LRYYKIVPMVNNKWLKSVGITENDVISWVNHKNARSVVVEELGQKYAVFLIDLNNKDIIEQIDKGIKTRKDAEKIAQEWIENNNI
jgi:hypothetical protein